MLLIVTLNSIGPGTDPSTTPLTAAPYFNIELFVHCTLWVQPSSQILKHQIVHQFNFLHFNVTDLTKILVHLTCALWLK